MKFKKIIVITLVMLEIFAFIPIKASNVGENKNLPVDETVPLLAESPPIYPPGEVPSDELSESKSETHTSLLEKSLPSDLEGAGEPNVAASLDASSEKAADESEAPKSAYRKIDDLTYFMPHDDSWSPGKANQTKVALVVNAFRNELRRITHYFLKQPGILTLNGRVAVVGDVHGDYVVLDDMIDKLSFDLEEGSINYVVFLGDMLDRGPSSSITLTSILSFCENYPDKVYLLRGNHETMSMYACGNSQMPARNDPLLRRIDLETMCEFFDSLPYAAIINGTTLAVHGGVPHRDYWEEFWKGEKLSEYDEKTFKLMQGVLWSDYTSSGDGIKPNILRGFREGDSAVLFNEDTVREFLRSSGKKELSYLIRGHQVFGIPFNQSPGLYVTTVFSAVNGQPPSVQAHGASVAIVTKLGPPREYAHFG